MYNNSAFAWYNYSSGWLNAVTLTGLTPATMYYYQIGACLAQHTAGHIRTVSGHVQYPSSWHCRRPAKRAMSLHRRGPKNIISKSIVQRTALHRWQNTLLHFPAACQRPCMGHAARLLCRLKAAGVVLMRRQAGTVWRVQLHHVASCRTNHLPPPPGAPCMSRVGRTEAV